MNNHVNATTMRNVIILRVNVNALPVILERNAMRAASVTLMA